MKINLNDRDFRDVRNSDDSWLFGFLWGLMIGMLMTLNFGFWFKWE